MNLTKVAIVLLVLVGLLLGGLILMQSKQDSKSDASKSAWNQPNKELPNEFPRMDDFLLLMNPKESAQHSGLNNIAKKWQPGNAIILIELMFWLQGEPICESIEKLVAEKLGMEVYDRNTAKKIIWSEPVVPHPEYATFKKHNYSRVQLERRLDSRFTEYFNQGAAAEIRLDEIEWGGVKRDGIPPLDQPKMLTVAEADYLQDTNVVFGVELNGDARAYPKRILAWHEMFRDTIGGQPVAGVYCTLCGTVIMYKTNKESGGQYTLGTSGFLYRSNKLMYDHETKSLWSTMRGVPVVGPLTGKGIELPYHSVVSTTWGEWKKRHPDTKVLSLDTGEKRDYSEGAAYKPYFATDKIMFEVPKTDSRLKNKAEILAIRIPGEPQTMAISADFLAANPIYHTELSGTELVVLTDASGANRVYECEEVQFEKLVDADKVVDADGTEWAFDEDVLTNGTRKLPRFSAHRAFWFGWFSAFPDTTLVK